MVKARNIIVVTGKIKAIRENRQSATIIIENQGEKVTSYPIFSVYDTDLIRGFRVNMRVQITAHAENRKSIDFDDSVTYIKDFVVDKMERQKRMLAPYLLNEKISEYEGGFSRDRNTCLMIGKVFHVYHPNGRFYGSDLTDPKWFQDEPGRCRVFQKTGRTGSRICSR